MYFARNLFANASVINLCCLIASWLLWSLSNTWVLWRIATSFKWFPFLGWYRSQLKVAKQLRFSHQVFFFKPQEKAAALMMGIIAGIFLLCKGIYLRCIILLSFASGQNSCNDHEFIIPILVLEVCCQPLGLLLLQEGHFKEIKQHIGCVLLTKRILSNAEGNWEQRHQTRAIRTHGKKKDWGI